LTNFATIEIPHIKVDSIIDLAAEVCKRVQKDVQVKNDLLIKDTTWLRGFLIYFKNTFNN